MTRPFLVIPKLIEQPTWGGDYIVKAKNWQTNPKLGQLKIGQSYELYSGSNLSLLNSSANPAFSGELADSKNVTQKTSPANSVSLKALINDSPSDVLGLPIVNRFGPQMPLLNKFTQGLGNSFQLHIKDGTIHPQWKPKPESWYYFEPGLITLGIKIGTDLNQFQLKMLKLQGKILRIGSQVKSGSKTFNVAMSEIKQLVADYNPWQYVNVFPTERDQLVDLSPCGIHHSWEEDPKTCPQGNVLYEVQLDVMDDVATLRSFDKGKMAPDGSTRPLQIDEYFKFLDRDLKVNDPATYKSKHAPITDTAEYALDRLMETKYYTLDRVHLKRSSAKFTDKLTHFRHVFVKSGKVDLVTEKITVTITAGHSGFIPAAVSEFALDNKASDSVILISY